MCDDDDGMSLIFVEVPQEVHYFYGLDVILSCSRLIYDDDAWAKRKNRGDRYSLAQSLGQEKRMHIHVFFTNASNPRGLLNPMIEKLYYKSFPYLKLVHLDF